jgi:hypothetical protein
VIKYLPLFLACLGYLILHVQRVVSQEVLHLETTLLQTTPGQALSDVTGREHGVVTRTDGPDKRR